MADPEVVNARLGLEPQYAGYLEGILVNPLYLAVLGVTLAILGLVLFVVAYVASDYEVGFAHLPTAGAAYALTVLAFIVLVGGAIYVLLAVFAWGSRQKALADDEFKVEPRDYELYSGVGGTHYHEVVKVRCRYCGTLNEPSATKCIACGGNP